MRNFILGTFFALFLSFIAAGAQNSEATYYIINFNSDSDGNQLAATFKGESNVIVTTFADGAGIVTQRTQQWIITSDQYIIPVNAQYDAATAQDDDVVIDKKDDFKWTIKKIADQSYTIAHDSQFWDLDDSPIDGDNILLNEESVARSTQAWKLVPVE